MFTGVRHFKREKVEFVRDRMTAEQITAILTMLKENRQGRLKNIWICRPSFAGTVSQTLLQEAWLNQTMVIRVEIPEHKVIIL